MGRTLLPYPLSPGTPGERVRVRGISPSQSVPEIEQTPMPQLPTLDTPRLRLRPFTLDDAPSLLQICSDREVAATTLTLPHPYELKHATEWIPKHAVEFDAGEAMTLATTLRGGASDGLLVGNISLRIHKAHQNAEMGYLVGKAYWGRGYCTEAARAAVGYGLAPPGPPRPLARHLARNPAAGRGMP